MHAYDVEIFQAVTAGGAKCFFVTGGGHSMWIQDEAEMTSPPKLLSAMAKNGMPITDKDASKAIVERVEACQPYTGEPPVDRSGHVGNAFAWPDGTVNVPEGQPEPVTIYKPWPGMFRQSGTLSRFKRHCASAVKDEPLLLFAMLAPLVAVFRPLTNPIEDLLIEIVAPFSDLSPLHHLVASVTGGHEAAIAYQALAFHEALALPRFSDPHADHLLIVHNAEHFFASKAAGVRANEARQLLSAQLRAVTQPNSTPRTVLLIDRVSLASLVGQESDIGRLLSHRTVTLVFPPERPHGLFSKLPPDFPFASMYTAHLRKVTAADRGVVYRRFVQRLVQQRADDPHALIAIYEKRVATFVKQVAHDPNDSAAAAAVELFGHAYAVGRFAQDWNLLPSGWRLGPKLREAYCTYYIPVGPNVAFVDELRALTRRPDAVCMGYEQPESSDENLATAKLIIDHGQRSIDVVIRPGYLDAFIKNGTKRLNDVDVEPFLQCDGRHKMIKKRKITKGEGRFYVFRLTREEAFNI